MEPTKKELLNESLYSPLVGKSITIVDSKNSLLVGISGTIIYETKYDFILKTHSGEKRVRKDLISFKIEIKGKLLYMDGNLLYNTLQNRIKKVK